MTSRHWRQRFNGNEDFIYRRTMRIDTPDGPMNVKAGDIVNKDHWSGQRLKRLWDSRYIELAYFRDRPYHNPHETKRDRKLRRDKTQRIDEEIV